MKLYIREQNLVTDISVLKYFLHVTSDHAQTVHFWEVRIYRPRFSGKNKNLIIYWDLEEVST